MSVKFLCPQCGRIVHSTAGVGENTRCSCGADVPVPADATALQYLCRTCGAKGTSPTCGQCGARAQPARLLIDASGSGGASGEGAGLRGRSARLRQRARDLDSFRVGSVIGRSLRIYARHGLAFTATGLLLFLPALAFVAFVVLTAGPGQSAFPDNRLTVEAGVLSLLGLLLGQLLSGTLIDAVIQVLRARQPSMGRSIGFGFKAVFRVLAVVIVMSVLLGVSAAVVYVPLVLLTKPFVALIPTAGVVIWLMPRFWAVVPVAVVEAPGLVATIRRSNELSKDVRWRILLLMLVTGLLNGLVFSVASALSDFMSPLVEQLVSQGVGVLVACFGAVVSTVGYHDLRHAQDGVDTEELAAIFE